MMSCSLLARVDKKKMPLLKRISFNKFYYGRIIFETVWVMAAIRFSDYLNHSTVFAVIFFKNRPVFMVRNDVVAISVNQHDRNIVF